ncbi:hypothetical protein OQA88_9798 [Cercophora sp. LCS_1]
MRRISFIADDMSQEELDEFADQENNVGFRGNDSEGSTDDDCGPAGTGKQPSRRNVTSSSSKLSREKTNIDYSLKPMHNPEEMFEDMLSKVDISALKENPVQLTVATLCSGTDAPIFALQMLSDAAENLGNGTILRFKHIFSCEIEPFKQAFIRRNVGVDTLIFRDVVEMATNKDLRALTAAGFWESIPQDKIDVLFCGCSCVDYSGLNAHRTVVKALDEVLNFGDMAGQWPVAPDEGFVKSLDEAMEALVERKVGESSRTFLSGLILINRTRPKTVILENVDGAPWGEYQHYFFPRIGYFAVFLRLDSKDFYIPQTRRRGYLVAIDASVVGLDKAKKVGERWEEILKTLHRAASSSVVEFLRSSEDPTTIQARADMEGKRANDSISWPLSHLRHQRVRQEQNLRTDDNPFSKKVMRGGRVIRAAYPSHSWQAYWAVQPARVVDLMDIIVAATLRRGVDVRFKPYLVDASQNVDRSPLISNPDGACKNTGGIGCITPSGQPIITDRMRPLTGFEVLALQALPVQHLTISTETQAQLQDLAGNAMSVTVVGAVTLALIQAASFLWSTPRNRPAEPTSPRWPDEKEPSDVVPAVPKETISLSDNVSRLCEVAARVRRVCFCSYAVVPRASERPRTLRCEDCGTTVCETCRVPGTHNFTAEAPGPIISAAEARIALLRLLPAAFVLPSTPSAAAIAAALTNVDHPDYCSAVANALAPSTYYLRDIKITEVVTVTYNAKRSQARLVLGENEATVYVYMPADHAKRAEMKELFVLDQPVARLELITEQAGQLQWSVWVHRRVDFTLPIRKHEDGALYVDHLKPTIGSFPAELEPLKDAVNHEVGGTFVPRPSCGTALDSLMAKNRKATGNDKEVFLMLHPSRTSDPFKDSFVWTHDARKHEAHEYREVLLNVDPRVRVRSAATTDREWSVFWRGYWSPVDLLEMVVAQPPTTDIVWGVTTPFGEAGCPVACGALAPVLAVITTELGEFPAPAARTNRLRPGVGGLGPGEAYPVPVTERESFLQLVAFAATEVQGGRVPQTAEGQRALAHFRKDWVKISRACSCGGCAAGPPPVFFSAAGPSEDPRRALEYEALVRAAPRPISLGAALEGSTLRTTVRFQPAILGLRCRRALRPTLQPSAFPSMRDAWVNHRADKVVELSFKVELDYCPASNAQFRPMLVELRPCSADNLDGIDEAASDRSATIQAALDSPPRFRKTGSSLTPGQVDVVRWMLQREIAPLPFIESEVDEEIVAGLNLRALGKAE